MSFELEAAKARSAELESQLQTLAAKYDAAMLRVCTLQNEAETLKMQLPVVGAVTFPPGCSKYEEALRLAGEAP